MALDACACTLSVWLSSSPPSPRRAGTPDWGLLTCSAASSSSTGWTCRWSASRCPRSAPTCDLTTSQLQWIVSGYVLGYGGLLLLGGRPPTCSAGGATCSSRWASSPSPRPSAGSSTTARCWWSRASSRARRAAFTAPAGLSIITTTFAEGPERNRALSIYTASGASGFSLGLVLGGLLTELGWRWTFLLPVPIALALLAIGAARDPARPRRGDSAQPLRRARGADADHRDAAARADHRRGTRPGLGLGADDRGLRAERRCCCRCSSPSSAAPPRRSCASGSCARARWCARTSA